MTKHRDDDLGGPGGGERYLPPQEDEAQKLIRHSSRVRRRERKTLALRNIAILAAELMRQDSNASAGEADAKLRRALAATGFLHKSEAPE